jgi:hypothetical protein
MDSHFTIINGFLHSVSFGVAFVWWRRLQPVGFSASLIDLAAINPHRLKPAPLKPRRNGTVAGDNFDGWQSLSSAAWAVQWCIWEDQTKWKYF